MWNKIILISILVSSVCFSQSTYNWRAFRSEVSFNRPSDTTSYNGTLYPIISASKTTNSSTLLEFTDAGYRKGFGGVINTVTIYADSANTTNLAIRSSFYNDSTAIPRIPDNSPNRVSDSGSTLYIGHTDHYFDAIGNGSGSSMVRNLVTNVTIYFNPLSTTKSIFCRLTDISPGGLYKPKNGGKFKIVIEGFQYFQ